METLNDLPIHRFANSKAWEAWLDTHHGQPAGVWLKIAKKTAPNPSVTYDEALDVALCYGWIDGQLQKYDDQYYLQKFTPRRPKSVWSKRNVTKVTALIKAGRMRPSGIAEVKAAKNDGRWQQAYDSPGNMTMPDDFKQMLDQNPKAKAIFEGLNKTNTYSFLWRLQTAKNPQTRQARMVQFVAMLNNGETFHPNPAKGPAPKTKKLQE